MPINKGRQFHTLATRHKMSLNQRGKRNSFWGRTHSAQTLALISKKLKGRKFTKAHRAKIRRALKGKPKSPEARLKMSIAKRGILKGKNSPTWNGGITPLRKSIRTSAFYREWRKAILKRDGFKCTQCSRSDRWLEADHYPITFAAILARFKIRSLKQAYSCAMLWDITNGRTLCRPCHEKTPSHRGHYHEQSH